MSIKIGSDPDSMSEELTVNLPSESKIGQKYVFKTPKTATFQFTGTDWTEKRTELCSSVIPIYGLSDYRIECHYNGGDHAELLLVSINKPDYSHLQTASFKAREEAAATKTITGIISQCGYTPPDHSPSPAHLGTTHVMLVDEIFKLVPSINIAQYNREAVRVDPFWEKFVAECVDLFTICAVLDG